LRLLKGSILKYDEPTGNWETMHPVWDIQFLVYWNLKRREEGENPEETVKQIVDAIVNLRDEETAYGLIYGLTNIEAYKQELFGLFEPSLEVPDYMDEAKKARLYAFSLRSMWYKLERFEKSLEATTKAVEIFEKLIKTDEKFKEELAEAYHNRGTVHSAKGKYDLAIQDYNKAIEINPKLAVAYSNRGSAHSSKGEYDLAIQDFDEAIEINPKDAEAYYNRGSAHSSKGEYDLAIQDFDKAIEINPKYAEAYSNRGNAHYEKGEYDLALLDFDKAIEINPKDAMAYSNRGNTHLAKGEYDLALLDYNKAIKINPKYADAYYNRGNAHYEKGEYDFCVTDWSNAGFLFLIRAYKENPAFLENAITFIAQAFNFDKSEHVIKFEAGAALSAILKP